MDEPAIQYARTKDGVNIAYSMVGKGPLLVDVPQSGFGGLHALEIPAFSNYYAELSKRFTILGFDQRGFGHSQRGAFQHSLESHLADLEAVIEAAGVANFTLFAGFWSAGTGVAYADAYPAKVRSLVLWHGFLDGRRRAREARGPAVLISRDFELFMLSAVAATYPPTVLDSERMVQFCLRAADPDTVSAFFAASSSVDVTAIAETLEVPTLVLQRREASPSEAAASQDIAARIPGARLQRLSGRSSYPAFGDIDETVEAIADFADALETPRAGEPAPPSTFQTIMFTDLESSTALTQRVGDEAAQDVLHGHNDAVRKSLADTAAAR
jgi:pimeloyl-ACP methyl ester carboxylesterase